MADYLPNKIIDMIRILGWKL